MYQNVAIPRTLGRILTDTFVWRPDFDKGCYIGQEVIARLDTYNKVQKKLISINIKGSSDVIDSPGSVITSQSDDYYMVVARKKYLKD